MKFQDQLKRKLRQFTLSLDERKIEKQMKMDQKPRSFLKAFESILHKFIVFFTRIILRWIFGEKGQQMPPIKNLILMESASSLALKIRTRKLTSVEVMTAFIERIKEVNPLLNCVVDNRFEEALKDAARADKLIESETLTVEQLANEKPFLGVPISTKDCLRVKDLLYTSGLWMRRNMRGDKDSEVIALMRRAGAIPFALTNVSECCMWWESVNTVHGRTNNPYDTNRIVGGSSGGEGCIQASAASPLGIGSDIGGSIRIPAFFNGIFGHKPSKNIVSNEGQYPEPLSDEQSSFLGIGPMSRYATDLKPVLKIIAAENAKKLRLDDPVDLKKVKIFYQHSDGGGHLVSLVDKDIKDAMDKVAAHFRDTVQSEVRKVYISQLKFSVPLWITNMKHSSDIGFDDQLMNLEGRITVWWEFIKWIFRQSNHTFIGILTAHVDRRGPHHGSPKHKFMVQKKDELFNEFQDLLGEDGVFLYPTHPTPAPYHTEPTVRALNFGYTGIINILGLPATAVPLGLGREGVPIGLQVVGGLNQDRLCLAVACELERAFGGWVAPKVLA